MLLRSSLIALLTGPVGCAMGAMLQRRPPKISTHIIFHPETTPGDAAVVWLHGFGDGPEGWASGMQALRRRHPTWMWVHLRAPPLPQSCYRGTRVPGWGDYREEGCTTVGSEDYDNSDIVSDAILAEVHGILADLERVEGIAPERIVIGGFSMGATAAAEITLRYPRRLGGLVVLNGWLLPGARAAIADFPTDGFPVLVSHGSSDEQVGYDCGAEAARLLREAGAAVQFEVQEGLTHVESGFGPGKAHAEEFLRKLLGATTEDDL